MSSGVALHIFPQPTQKPQKLHNDLKLLDTQSPLVSRAGVSKSPVGVRAMVFELPAAARSPTVEPNQIQFPDSTPTAPSPSIAVSDRRYMASPELDHGFRGGAASPAPTDVLSARSGSPTLVRSNSGASARSTFTSREPPLMQSIFPTYNPNVPLTHQQYRPRVSPLNLRVAPEKISRAPYSPDFYSSSSSSATPFTPLYDLQGLWDAANGKHHAEAAETYILQMHRPSQTPPSKKAPKTPEAPALTFGVSSLEPFFCMTHSGPSLLREAGHDPAKLDEDDEIIVRRHHPMKSKSLPVAHLTIRAPPPFQRHSSSGTIHSVDTQTESPSLVTTIYPKLAALAALDIAANSPAASSIAQFDPDATSPAAQRLAEDAVRGAAERESCCLQWTQSSGGSTSSGRYELFHPSLGIFAISTQGNIQGGLSLSQPPTSSPSPSAKTGHTTAKIEIHAPAHCVSRGDFPPRKDSVRNESLATLDLAKDTLSIDGAALQRIDNPFLVDVVVSTLLAVAVAETRREQAVAKAFMFAGPPSATAAAATEKETAKKAKRDAREKKATQARSKGKGKADEREGGATVWDRPAEKEELPRLTRGILSGLQIGFSATVWVLGVGVKVASGTVVVVSKCVGNKK